MTGIVKKVDKRGFGIIDGADGSKIPFILADVAHRRLLKPGQTVLFSVRRVNGTAFAKNIYPMPHPVHLSSSSNRVARQNKK